MATFCCAKSRLCGGTLLAKELLSEALVLDFVPVGTAVTAFFFFRFLLSIF